jgi:solute:Na+ symporter, SSS family
LNCLSAVGVVDYYRKLRPGATDRQRLLVGKVIVAVCGLLTVGIAVIIAAMGERVLSLYYAATSIISGGLAGVFLLAFFSRRANKQGLWVGIGANLVFTAWATLTSGKNKMLELGEFNYTWPSVMIGVIGHMIILVVGYLASLPFPTDAHLKQEWTIWGWLEKRKAPNPDASTATATPDAYP